MKWLRWTLLSLLGVLLLIGAVVTWMLNSHAGTQSALRLVQNVLGNKLSIARVEGTLAGPLALTQLRYGDPAGGPEITADAIRVDVSLRELLAMRVHVNDAQIAGVHVDIRPSNQPEEPPSNEPFTLKPPIDIVVDRFAARDVNVTNIGAPVVQISRALAAATWTDAGIAVKQLDVRSPQGEVHFIANVGGDRVYVGNGRGSFKWRQGEYDYRGTLTADAKDENAHLTLNLSNPLRAQLLASLKQTNALPWTFSLNVPEFDPRSELMPDSKMQSLGANVQGAGSTHAGQVTGTLLVDGDRLHVHPLRFTRTEQQLDIDTNLRINDEPGKLHAVGHIRTDQQPAVADVNLDWNDIVVPEKWAGQVLNTNGKVHFEGNAQQFATHGRLALGPPKQLANIALNAAGTSDAIQLKQFDIVQPNGRLAAAGRVNLKPRVAWDMKAQANRFDPGAFAAAWKGHLNFDLASTGEIADAGPSAKLALTQLQGELRGRALSGRADLQVTPDKRLEGVMDLRSGQSELHVQGNHGQAMDALVTMNIASLNDWLPDANGRVNASYRITGRWPELRIAGTTSASEVMYAGTRVGGASLDLDVTNPQKPSGRANFRANDIAASGFTFQRLQTQVSGNLEAHQLSFSSTGSPLDADFSVQGGLKDKTWNGTLQSLMLDVERAAHLTLREPARIVYSPEGTQISQTCLQDKQIQLCVAGDMHQDGSLAGQYSLHDVPLALANALKPSLPLALEGTLQGEGNVKRDADGSLHGRATITSPSGQVAQRLNDKTDEKQTLLRYSDLRLAANLAGPDAQANVHVGLDEGGHVDGEIAANGLSEAVTPIKGSVKAGLPTLAPVAIFVPQLANLKGSVDSQLAISGTVQEPRIAGHVRANDLEADVPMLGLELRNGRLDVEPREDGTVQLAGGIHSGDGELNFEGSATTATGAVDMRVRGDKFLAADIPSANVIVAPNLEFQRAPDGMKLNGEVKIPKAKVDLQKAPRGGKKVQQASTDVVVIDERTTEQETASAPLQANITVILGDRVELTGFGLEARVDGQLGVREVPGVPTSGSGEIRIQGRYKAYGQDLTIRRGQILYAGTPLDNPRLNIEAVREIEDADVIAGLRITGSAQQPQLDVFSDPAMGEANALAYLVTGKPLDQVGSGGGDGDMLQSAAESLGSAAGGLLAKKIGKRLGVDEVSVKESEALGGSSALTVGQYLSPRLFLSYGVGLFEPGDVITLRYKLSRKLALQAERGPADTRAGVQYRIEK